jgi:putative Mg2+ transporter-C (MgtC) family protein
LCPVKLGHNARMPSQGELILRLLLAATLAGVLGVERELTEQPAGFRTHILVGLGAALFTVVSAYGFQAIVGVSGPHPQVSADLSRVASQIVVGIGFLGGGAIVKYGASIRGLTTAANLWITAAVGTAIGVGLLALGTATTGITLVALVGLRPLRALVRRYAIGRDEFVIDADPAIDLQTLLSTVRSTGAVVQEVRLTEEPGEALIRLAVRQSRRVQPGDLAAKIASVPYIRNVDWST